MVYKCTQSVHHHSECCAGGLGKACLILISSSPSQLCGIALIVVGIVVQVALHKTPVMEDASGSAGPLVVIGVGVVIFLVSFFGCCGAWKENYCMVTTVTTHTPILPVSYTLSLDISSKVQRNGHFRVCWFKALLSMWIGSSVCYLLRHSCMGHNVWSL